MMLRSMMFSLLAVTSSACSKSDGVPSCEAAAERAGKVAGGGLTAERVNEGIADMLALCVEEAWSAEKRTCVANAKDLDAFGICVSTPDESRSRP